MTEYRSPEPGRFPHGHGSDFRNGGQGRPTPGRAIHRATGAHLWPERRTQRWLHPGNGLRLAPIPVILAILVLLPVRLAAQAADGIHTPFSIWLMNNESRVLGQLAADRRLLDAMSMGNGMLLAPRPPWPKPENRFWRMHLKFFAYLTEANEVYRLARQFGSGDLAKVISSVHPGEWATLGCRGFPTLRAREIAPFLNDVCGKAYLAVLGLDQSRDRDLAGRLDRATRKLTDTERRLLNNYFGNFLALYPTNRTTRRLHAFLQTGLSKQFVQGVASLLMAKPAGGADDSGGLLADLASTADEAASTTVDPALLGPDAVPADLGTDTGTGGGGQGTASEAPEAGGPQIDIFNVLGPDGETGTGTP